MEKKPTHSQQLHQMERAWQEQQGSLQISAAGN
jgi:hypothetical protein